MLYCHFMKKNTEDLKMILKERYEHMSEDISLYELLDSAVDKAVKRKTGHLDLFLRFLLGISLEANQKLLQDLLTQTHNTSEDIKKITQSIKYEIKNNDHLSADRSINLFLCLSEVNDQTLYREIQEFVRSDKHSEKKFSPGHCSAILYMLQTSEEVIEEFDLKKYNTTQEGRRRLIPAIINCTRALFSWCDLTARCCESLSSSLQSSESLRELDLSYNDLQDSGVKLISDALKSSTCQLQTLRLSWVNLTVECCESLSSCLQSSESLRELDLSNNDLQDSGVKLISDALKSSTCHLHTLRLSGCMVTDEGCCYLASALSSNPSHLRELDLSYNHPEHSSLQLFSDRLNDPNYTLDKLNVDHGGERRITSGPCKYDCDLTVDLNTVNTLLKLSEDNRKITCGFQRQSYPDHPERFDHIPQVLCREILTGRCYWETEWSGSGVDISVSYKSIDRKDFSHDSFFGFNEKSWSLYCYGKRFTARHNKKKTVIDVTSGVCNRVGVYVDCSAGILSFYRISDTHRLTHLHTFNTTFTEPLYAGFNVYSNSSVRLI